MPSHEVPALQIISLEDRIRNVRRRGVEMVETLDQRMSQQRELVRKILETGGWTEQEILSMDYNEIDDDIIKLCYRLLKDIEYIDNLR